MARSVVTSFLFVLPYFMSGAQLWVSAMVALRSFEVTNCFVLLSILFYLGPVPKRLEQRRRVSNLPAGEAESKCP